VPLEFRARLLKPRAARLELHNTFFEWSDEWIEPDDTVFDLMYRSCDLIEADVEARLGRGEGAVGYSTCLCGLLVSLKASRSLILANWLVCPPHPGGVKTPS
jgi:hypothetical protein